MSSAIARNRCRQIRKGGELAYASLSSAIANEFNDSEMSAGFVISTIDEDREGDVIEPQGCLEYLHEYKSNPIVFFDHDQKQPIGSSEGPDGRFHFTVGDRGIRARCFFHDCEWDGKKIGEDAYKLVRKKIFRGASIGFLPLQSKKRGYGKDSGTRYMKIRVTEWSVCPLQSNQNALREFTDELRAHLDRGEVVNKSMASALRTRYLAGAAPIWSPGATLERSAMSKRHKVAVSCFKDTFGTREECRKSLAARGYVPVADPIDNGDSWTYPLVAGFDGAFDDAKEITKGMSALLVTKAAKPPKKKPEPLAEEEEAEPKEKPDEAADAVPAEGDDADDEEADDADDSALESGDTDTDTGTGGDDEEGEAVDHTMKAGAHTLAERLAHHETALNAHDDRAGRNEDPDILAFLDKEKSLVEQQMAAIHELFKKKYPGGDLDEMADGYRAAPEEGADDETPPVSEEGDTPDLTGETPPAKVKKSLKQHQGKVKAAAEFLEGLNGHRSVHKSLHAACGMHAKCLGEVTKDMDGGDDEGEQEEAGMDDDQVEKGLDAILKTIEDVRRTQDDVKRGQDDLRRENEEMAALTARIR